MDETFRPQERIRKKKDFLLIYKKGRRYRGKYFSLVYLSNNLDFSRVAIVVSRKFGNAAQRNKVKRWIRDLFRRNKNMIKSSVDMIIIPKKEILNLPWPSLQQEYVAAIEYVGQKTQSK